MTAEPGMFMSIAAVMGPDGKSFEEVRVDDYIKAYQATGRPPIPCPQEPTNELQRKALNLPPLFQPFTPSPSYLSGLLQAQTESPKPMAILNPSDIPPAQEFRLLTVNGEKYHAISCMTEYENFSHEELRYYAYVRGHIKPPTPVAMDPFVLPSETRLTTVAVAPGTLETLENISAQPEYNKHCPEELRIAYLLHGRQLTSAELLQSQTPSAPTTLTPPAASWLNPTLPSTTPAPTAIPPPIFAASPPAASKFTFGLR